MPRRATVTKREIYPDAKYQSLTITRLVNRMMLDGKKSTTERFIYDALDIINKRENKEPLSVMEKAIKNVTPMLEVKPRRVGGATYQVPVEVKADRGLALALRWIIKSARTRSGKSIAEKLASELIDASKEQGASIKKREDTHRMAEANRAFAHYRW